MKIGTSIRAVMAALLFSAILPSQTTAQTSELAKNDRIAPISYRMVDPQTSSKSAARTAMQKTTASKRIGTIANAYTSLNKNTNQIAYDIATNRLIVLYRGQRSLHNNEVGQLAFNSSTDKGATWSGETPTLNTGITNTNGQMAARHPSLNTYNSGGTLNVAALWSNLSATNNFGTIGFAGGVFGGPYTKGTWSPSTTPGPTFSVANRIVINAMTGKMYSIVSGLDPTTSPPSGLGEVYLATSTDFGKSWTVNTNNPVLVDPMPDNTEVYSTSLDISPDGQKLGIAFVSVVAGSGFFRDMRLGYIESTNDGASWSQPRIKQPRDWKYLNLTGFELITEYWHYPFVSLALDANGTPHILSSVLFYQDASNVYPYIGEVTFSGSDFEFYYLSPLRDSYQRKWLASQPTTAAQNVFVLYNENEFAKSADGYKLYAKWIDRTATQNDSTRDVYMTAKDIRSNNPTRGWLDPVNVTNTVNGDEIFTKMAPIVDTDGRIHMIYTRMADGEFPVGRTMPASDDLEEAEMFYISDVVLNVTVSAEKDPVPFEFTLQQNYPNPFNPGTQIGFTLPASGFVRLRVFNLLGQEIVTLIEGFKSAGHHQVNFDASTLPSGMYMYRLESDGNVATRKMMVSK